MPLLPASLIEPLWVEFAALIGSDRSEFDPTHPWGCHRRRIPDRVVFDHVIAALVHGSGYERVATPGCSDRTIRRRLDDWAEAGVGEQVLRTTLAGYDQMIGLDLDDLSVDGSITKSPCGQTAHAEMLHPAAAKVLATLDREWEGLARHREYPELPLDNNTAERALRGPVVGRKNYYGSGSVVSARLASRVFTIAATAERAGLNPLAYLTAYLQECARAGGSAPTGAALTRFLPWAASTDDLTAWPPSFTGVDDTPGVIFG